MTYFHSESIGLIMTYWPRLPRGSSFFCYVKIQDATANDIPSDVFDVKGYPTLYFRSASGNLLQYDGDRTKDDMIEFIQKNRDKTGHQDSGKDEL